MGIATQVVVEKKLAKEKGVRATTSAARSL